jgi:apolipoprotein N-acyltransferase
MNDLAAHENEAATASRKPGMRAVPHGAVARQRLSALWRGLAPDLATLVLTAALLVPFTRLVDGWSAVGFVALVPWLWALDRARSLRHSVALGIGLSIVLAAGAFGWFPTVAARYTGYPAWAAWGVWLAAAPFLEPQPIVFALTRWLVRPRHNRALAFVIGWAAPAFAWIAIEWVLPRLLGDTLGYGLHGARAMRQAADLAGVRGLTLLLLMGNILVLAAGRSAIVAGSVVAPSPSLGAARRLAGAAAPACVLAAILACAWGYGELRLRSFQRPDESPLSVAIVQANLTDYARLRRELGTFDAAQAILDLHFALSDQAPSADLVVWPETVYPTTFGAPRSPEGAELDDRIRRFVSRRGVPLVFGAYDADASGEYNAAALLLPRGADVEHARYHKAHPFPFSEWVPEAIDSPALRERLPWAGRWRPGAGAGVWHSHTGSGDLRIGPLICYDAAFTAHAAEAARRGARLLVTLSNDSWFSGTPAPELHLVVSAFRSIETRLPQIRAANSGVSALIDATGEIRARTQFDSRAVLAGKISPSPRHSTTLVTRWGDWLGPMALVAALALIGAARARGADVRG